jgi:hypothetical protein
VSTNWQRGRKWFMDDSTNWQLVVDTTNWTRARKW